MENIVLNGLIVIGGISILGLVMARYSLEAVFDTMQLMMVYLQNRTRK